VWQAALHTSIVIGVLPVHPARLAGGGGRTYGVTVVNVVLLLLLLLVVVPVVLVAELVVLVAVVVVVVVLALPPRLPPVVVEPALPLVLVLPHGGCAAGDGFFLSRAITCVRDRETERASERESLLKVGGGAATTFTFTTQTHQQLQLHLQHRHVRSSKYDYQLVRSIPQECVVSRHRPCGRGCC
jgi:hypothetical protein